MDTPRYLSQGSNPEECAFCFTSVHRSAYICTGCGARRVITYRVSILADLLMWAFSLLVIILGLMYIPAMGEWFRESANASSERKDFLVILFGIPIWLAWTIFGPVLLISRIYDNFFNHKEHIPDKQWRRSGFF